MRKFARARGVCKLWLEEIDGNKRLWRRLNNRGFLSLEEVLLVINQFDEKSGSTMERLTVYTNWEESQNSSQVIKSINQLIQVILKSSQHLKGVSIFSKGLDHHGRQRLAVLSYSLLLELPNVVEFRISKTLSYQVLFDVRAKQLSSVNPRLIWIDSLRSSASPFTHLHISHSDLFQAIASLTVDRTHHHSTWRSVLSLCTHSLLHLEINLGKQDPGEELSPLELPQLRMLNLTEGNRRSPAWMLVAPSLTLGSLQTYSSLPSTGQLWVSRMGRWEDCLSSRCPKVQVLRLEEPTHRERFRRNTDDCRPFR